MKEVVYRTRRDRPCPFCRGRYYKNLPAHLRSEHGWTGSRLRERKIPTLGEYISELETEAHYMTNRLAVIETITRTARRVLSSQ